MRRRPLRYSLPCLIVLMTCCTIWLGEQAYQSRKYRLLEKKVAAANGLLVHEHEIVDEKLNRDAKASIPDVLANVLDESWYEKPVGLYLEFQPVTDDDLTFLRDYKQLEHIHLAFTNISDRGLAHVASVSNLQTLYLYNTKITDEGIESLSRLKLLRSLDIRNTNVTDKSFSVLSRLPLKTLDVRGSRMTKDGVMAFRRAHPNCQVEFSK